MSVSGIVKKGLTHKLANGVAKNFVTNINSHRNPLSHDLAQSGEELPFGPWPLVGLGLKWLILPGELSDELSKDVLFATMS